VVVPHRLLEALVGRRDPEAVQRQEGQWVQQVVLEIPHALATALGRLAHHRVEVAP